MNCFIYFTWGLNFRHKLKFKKWWKKVAVALHIYRALLFSIPNSQFRFWQLVLGNSCCFRNLWLQFISSICQKKIFLNNRLYLVQKIFLLIAARLMPLWYLIPYFYEREKFVYLASNYQIINPYMERTLSTVKIQGKLLGSED